jgi:LacI family transcriptional regulator
MARPEPLGQSRLSGSVTLADIARRARVSPITASRALRHASLVAGPTRERVLRAAADLGYTPNLLARGLVQNRTATVGVVILDLANPFFAPMVSAIEAVAAKRGFLVVIGESGREAEWERRHVERFQQLRIGGLIVTPLTPRVEHLGAARAAGTPVVVLARVWDAGDYVTADNVEGGGLVARHLVARGHRRAGLVRPAEPGNTAIEARARGYRAVLDAAGVPLAAAWELETPGTLVEDGIDAADRLLALPAPRPTAVFATTDRQAMGLVHRLVEWGVRVPDDVAVVGYDDIPYAACTRVPLTTVEVPMRRMGELAAEILFDRLDGTGPEAPRQVRLPPRLMVRASCP